MSTLESVIITMVTGMSVQFVAVLFKSWADRRSAERQRALELAEVVAVMRTELSDVKDALGDVRGALAQLPCRQTSGHVVCMRVNTGVQQHAP